jgi:hypothetical protein
MWNKSTSLWIVGILFVVALIYISIPPSYDNFQVTPTCAITPDAAKTAASNFWKILDDKDPVTTQKILRVSSPDPSDPNDHLPIKFSNYMSVYALARNSDLSGARSSLFSCYDTLQSEMATNLYDNTKREAWNRYPKLETCKKLDAVRAKYIIDYTNLNKMIQDLSGTEITAEKMVGENRAIQAKLTNICKTSPISQACKNLAEQDLPLYELLSKYDNVNVNLFSNSVDISNNLLLVNQVYRVMGCTEPNQFFSTYFGGPTFWVDKNKKYPIDIGTCLTCHPCTFTNIAPQSFFDILETSATPFECSMVRSSQLEIKDSELPLIDTDTLRTKLQEMSPYYLSPDIVDAVTSSIENNSAADLQTTPEILANISKVIGNIKRFTNTP